MTGTDESDECKEIGLVAPARTELASQADALVFDQTRERFGVGLTMRHTATTVIEPYDQSADEGLIQTIERDRVSLDAGRPFRTLYDFGADELRRWWMHPRCLAACRLDSCWIVR